MPLQPSSHIQPSDQPRHHTANQLAAQGAVCSMLRTHCIGQGQYTGCAIMTTSMSPLQHVSGGPRGLTIMYCQVFLHDQVAMHTRCVGLTIIHMLPGPLHALHCRTLRSEHGPAEPH